MRHKFAKIEIVRMPAATTNDAIAMLTEDHKAVKALFKQFEQLCTSAGTDDDKSAIVRQICTELSLHAQLEEELFYPALRDAIGDDVLFDEAEAEHATAKDLIAQLQKMAAGDELYDAKVTFLGEYVVHHIEEEEGGMFSRARCADVNTAVLIRQMAARKEVWRADTVSKDDIPIGAAVIKTTYEYHRPAKAARQSVSKRSGATPSTRRP